jgi:predicted small lipoprotein YifL
MTKKRPFLQFAALLLLCLAACGKAPPEAAAPGLNVLFIGTA